MDFFTHNSAYWTRVLDANDHYQQLNQSKSLLIEAQVFQKYTYKHGKRQPRVFVFDAELTSLTWHKKDSTRGLRTIPASSITDVTAGNDDFVCAKLQVNIKLEEPDLCLTIHANSRNLHLVAPTVRVRDAWVEAIRAFVLGQEKDFESELRTIRAEQEKEAEEVRKWAEELLAQNEETRATIDNLEKANEELTQKNQEIEEVLYGKRSLELQQEREQVWERKFSEKQAIIDRLENQVRLLTVQHHSLDSTATAKVAQLEDQLASKAKKVAELEDEFEEFKRQMKQTFNKSLVQKVQQYRESKEALNTYTAFLKAKVGDLEKEVALWQAVVHVHVLPLFKAKNPREEATFKAVLSFALDFMEKKLTTQKAQTDFVELLGNARRQLRS
jgi:hypothetical protein